MKKMTASECSEAPGALNVAGAASFQCGSKALSYKRTILISPPSKGIQLTDAANSTPANLFQTLGFQRLVSNEGGRATLEYHAGLHMCHSGGVVQGGFVTGWIDSAMAHAVIGSRAERGEHDVTPVSLELKISFFAPARPGPVTAKAWIERDGRSTCFVEGELLDSAGQVLAKGTSTVRVMSKSRIMAASATALSDAGG